MRKLIWTITATSLALAGLATAAPTAHAESTSKEQTIGIGTGGVIGAVAGGPVGLIIGAAIGAKLGDALYRKDTEIDSLTSSLDDSRGTIDNLEYDVRELKTDFETVTAELEQVERVSRPELVSLMQAGIAMDLLFRTDEHVLADTTGGRLNELAQTLSTMPDIQVQLDGFADERGNSDYNQQLSEKRVQFVREQLIAAGIDAGRISHTAHGEAPAQDDSVDSFALERRVSVKLFIDESPAFASNPD
ncbi:MAG: OmpA family protein [Gammaproteobacteria bacterium]|nr:OmpA family protein [Gammaproteobacteria bacterium]